MCIRDRSGETPQIVGVLKIPGKNVDPLFRGEGAAPGDGICLLYTSDAADERSSVDLGGRRIIKKKTQK